MDQRRARKVVRGQQKKLKDTRKWRYVEVECKRDDNEKRSPWTTACRSRKWNSFLRQADLRRRKVAVEGLIHALQHERPALTFDWLEGEGVTAEERLLELRRWIAAQLRPVMAPPSTPLPPAGCDPVEPLEANESDDDNDDDEEQDHQEELSDDGEDDGGEDEDDDGGSNEDDDQQSGNRKGKSKKGEDLELEVQVATLRLISALAVLCTCAHVHLLLGCPAATPSAGAPRHPKGNAKGGKAVPGVLEVLHRVLTSDVNNAAKRTRLRAEAMYALAVVCFVLEDQAVALETCETLAQLYLADVRPLADKDNSDDDDDNEAANDDDDDSDDEEDEEEEIEDDDDDGDDDDDEFSVDDLGALLVSSGKSEAEYAAALGTIAFLLSLVDSDEDVRAFIGSHKEALISLFFLADHQSSSRGTDVAGSSRVRTHAATLLGVLYRLSSANDDDDDNDDGDDEVEVDECEMSFEGKRRLVELCEARARSGTSGRRTRGGLERKWARRESSFFRGLAAELRADDYRRRLHQAADADEREEAARCNERVRRERHASRILVQWNSNEPRSFKIEGWRWDLTLGFLRKYFHQHFGRLEFRRATKLFPETSARSPVTFSLPQIYVRKVNQDTLKGRSTQTKRFRKEVDRNWTRGNGEYYRGNGEYRYGRQQQAEQRRGRSVEREWRLANERGLW